MTASVGKVDALSDSGAQRTLVELAAFFSAEPQLEAATLARAANPHDPPQVRSLNPVDEAATFFRAVVRTAVIDRAATWRIKMLATQYKPDGDEVEWLGLADVAAVQLATSRCSNLSPFAAFDPNDSAYKKRLQCWVVALSHGDGRKAYFFRAFSALSELGRKRGAALVSKNGSFHKVSEQIFLFDNDVDCFVFDGYIFVMRKRDYRRIFDQLDEVRRNAERAAHDLHQKVPIANLDEFAKACATDSRMADKMLAVRQRDYFGSLSYDMLRPVIEEFKLAIPCETVNGKVHLTFRSEPDQRFRILKLIDDDYLRSNMTKHLYEVNSKTEPPG
jgi:Domain of unknown function (DUF4868)